MFKKKNHKFLHKNEKKAIVKPLKPHTFLMNDYGSNIDDVKYSNIIL